MTIDQKRDRLKSNVLFTGYSTYQSFIKDTGLKHIPRTVFNKVIKDIHQEALNKLLEGNYNIKFPNIGLLFINKIDAKRIDFKTSKALGKQVFLRNTHTNGKTYSISFRPQWGGIPAFRFYNFTATRIHKRNFAKKLKNYELPNL